MYDEYELEHIPSVFILDDQGNIIGLSEGEEEPLALLKKYAKYNGYKAEGLCHIVTVLVFWRQR